ncbi:MAG: hypothetical protein K0U84_24695 [Actinomycetia bacterium]|nr:hypothetical protein [Actinomycetes bacterium]
MRDFARHHQLLVTRGGNGHGTWTDLNTYGIGILDIDDHDLNLGDLETYGGRNRYEPAPPAGCCGRRIAASGACILHRESKDADRHHLGKPLG